MSTNYFTDDTSLYVTVDEDAVNAANQLNDDLNQISTWAETWLVKFNANKSKTLTVTLKRFGLVWFVLFNDIWSQ